MSADLDTLNDAQLSEVFAVECAGYELTDYPAYTPGTAGKFWLGPDCEHIREDEIRFATSADAVLPFVAEYPFVDCSRDDGQWTVGVGDYETMDAEYATAPTLPRAICCALILAKRAENGGAK